MPATTWRPENVQGRGWGLPGAARHGWGAGVQEPGDALGRGSLRDRQEQHKALAISGVHRLPEVLPRPPLKSPHPGVSAGRAASGLGFPALFPLPSPAHTVGAQCSGKLMSECGGLGVLKEWTGNYRINPGRARSMPVVAAAVARPAPFSPCPPPGGRPPPPHSLGHVGSREPKISLQDDPTHIVQG